MPPQLNKAGVTGELDVGNEIMKLTGGWNQTIYNSTEKFSLKVENFSRPSSYLKSTW